MRRHPGIPVYVRRLRIITTVAGMPGSRGDAACLALFSDAMMSLTFFDVSGCIDRAWQPRQGTRAWRPARGWTRRQVWPTAPTFCALFRFGWSRCVASGPSHLIFVLTRYIADSGNGRVRVLDTGSPGLDQISSTSVLRSVWNPALLRSGMLTNVPGARSLRPQGLALDEAGEEI